MFDESRDYPCGLLPWATAAKQPTRLTGKSACAQAFARAWGARYGLLRPGWRPAHSCYGLPVTKERLKALIAEYGRTALGTYFGLFFLVLLGFAAAFSWGFGGADWLGAESVAGAGVLGAAYVATKATQPLRIFATIALTPLVARLVERLRPQTRQP